MNESANRVNRLSLILACCFLLAVVGAAALIKPNRPAPSKEIQSAMVIPDKWDGMFDDVICDDTGHEVVDIDEYLLAPDSVLLEEMLDDEEIVELELEEIELSDFGEQTAPKNDLLVEIGAPASVVQGRGSAKMRGAMVRAYGGHVAGELHALPAARPGTIVRPLDNDDPSENSARSRFAKIVENPFEAAAMKPLSTFSIDVDTASYSKVREFLMTQRMLPPPAAVRIEELVNYFSYDYEPPKGDHPFSVNVEVAGCPWHEEHRLVRIGLMGKTVEPEKRPPANLVFLLDVSGSMNYANKLPLVKEGMKLLLGELNGHDRVSIVVYAAQSGVHLPTTSGDNKIAIRQSLDVLRSGGSTNGEAGIMDAYQMAADNFVKDGINRVILCTDGDFNVGTTGIVELVDLAAKKAKDGIYLSILGFGMGNLNDEMLEALSNEANGNYAFIDNLREARKVLVEQLNGTLVTIAKDVKIQVEFNPANVESYRLIGYENRNLAAKDFADDKKDAGEIGAGHRVTALYEILPAKTADLKKKSLTVKLRYKPPAEDASKLLQHDVFDKAMEFKDAPPDLRFAAAVAEFGMILRDSQHKGTATLADVTRIATEATGDDKYGYRHEFVEMTKQAARLGK